MKKRSLLFVMFVLVQILVAGLLFGDDVRASVANGPSQSGIAKGPVAASLTPAGPVKSENQSQPRRRAGTPPKAEPELQFEGTITAASATSITVHDSHGNDVVLALTPATSIRKGDTTLAPGDLKVGDPVHVKATSANNVQHSAADRSANSRHAAGARARARNRRNHHRRVGHFDHRA